MLSMTRHDGNDDVPTFSWTPARTPDEVEAVAGSGGRGRGKQGAGEDS